MTARITAQRVEKIVGFGPSLGGYMLSSKLSIMRLRRYERECRTGSLTASDPLTRRELSEWAKTFQRYAKELEAAESQLAEG